MSAVNTIYAHVNRALGFFNQNNTYFAIGKTTPWADESKPPEPDTNTAKLDGVIGFKKVEVAYMVVPDETGTIAYRDKTWKVVPPDKAMELKAKHVYLETYIRYDELPLGEYRQIGVYTGLKLADGVSPAKFNLLPSEVASHGVLEALDNRKASPREEDQKEKISLVIEF